jgi:UDP-GlcNAc:undecaprenyl-phosphate GlcNAc-1-phosphate transferase
VKRKTLAGDTVLIYGAGRGGEILLREILNNRKLNVKPVGFLDDNTLKIGKKLQGYPVLGSFEDIERLRKKLGVNGMLISFNHHEPEHLEKIKRYCREKDIYLKQFDIGVKDIEL